MAAYGDGILKSCRVWIFPSWHHLFPCPPRRIVDNIVNCQICCLERTIHIFEKYRRREEYRIVLWLNKRLFLTLNIDKKIFLNNLETVTYLHQEIRRFWEICMYHWIRFSLELFKRIHGKNLVKLIRFLIKYNLYLKACLYLFPN